MRLVITATLASAVILLIGASAPSQVKPTAVRYVTLVGQTQAPTQHGPEPPEGWVCAHPGPNVPADHECGCQRKCIQNLECDEEGNCTQGSPPMTTMEDPKCKVYCHAKHCACPIEGCKTTHNE